MASYCLVLDNDYLLLALDVNDALQVDHLTELGFVSYRQRGEMSPSEERGEGLFLHLGRLAAAEEAEHVYFLMQTDFYQHDVASS